jgi:hypothetical protein
MLEMRKLILALVLLWPVGAVAKFYDGNQLQARCFSDPYGGPNSRARYNICVAYLAGLHDAANALSALGAKIEDGAPYGSCIPKGVNQKQLRRVWLNFAKANPQHLHLDAGGLALNAFEEAWRCKR